MKNPKNDSNFKNTETIEETLLIDNRKLNTLKKPEKVKKHFFNIFWKSKKADRK